MSRARVAIVAGLAAACLAASPAGAGAAVAVWVVHAPALSKPVHLRLAHAAPLADGGYYYAVIVLQPRGRYEKGSAPRCATSSDMQRADYGYPSAARTLRLTVAPARSAAGRWCAGGVYAGAIYAVPQAPPCEAKYPCRSEPYELPSPCWGSEGHRVCGVVALPRQWAYPEGPPPPIAPGARIVARFTVRFPSG